MNTLLYYDIFSISKNNKNIKLRQDDFVENEKIGYFIYPISKYMFKVYFCVSYN